MVSFQCDGCADTVKKPKLDQHRLKCWASFTCLDCSTTFKNQDYKSHTSCVSEAEKYQGALYKGVKKGKQPQPIQAAPTPATSVPVAVASAVSIPPSPTSAASPGAIHPSRLAVFDAPQSANGGSYSNRGGANGRGGRGGFAARGGRGGGMGGGRGMGASGENTFRPKDGMRTWGSPAVSAAPSEAGDAINSPTTATATGPVPSSQPTTATAAPIANGADSAEGSKKAKKDKYARKRDKGGTGSKANSNTPNVATTSSVPVVPAAPAASDVTTEKKEKKDKKRKRESSVAANTPAVTSTATNGEVPSQKTIKRLKKNLSKLDQSPSEVSLSAWLEKVGKSKKDALSGEDVLKGLKVGLVDGKWVLSA